MTLPSLRDWMFSAKTFAASMLALWIALRLQLDRPYWAMATVYIVAQPLTGAMRSQALYRFSGTVLGAIATIVLIPNLIDAPVLLIAALSLWMGVCIYFAILDRTPRSYVFLLAGYSAALIGFPLVNAPDTVWDDVLARIQEITLGIVCTTVVGTVIFPVPLGPALMARLDNWIGNAADWTLGVLSGAPEDAATAEARRKVAADSTAIATLTTHLAYDTSNLQTATVPVAILHQRVLLSLPVISGAAERLRLLSEAGGTTLPLRGLLDRMSTWIRAFGAADLAAATEIHAEIDALEPKIDATADWTVVMLAGVLERLREVTDLLHDIMALRRQIGAEEPRLATLRFAAGKAIATYHHRDHVMALHSALAAAFTIAVISTFWIATGWPDGGGAATLGAVACAIFAAQDDPTPGMFGFLVAATIALCIDGVYLFAILPRANSFEMLVLAFAPVFLVLGAMMSMPATARLSGPTAFLSATLLALSSRYAADFPSYLNSAAATIAGVGAAVIITRIIRSVSAETTAYRLLRRNRRAIATIAANRSPANLTAFVTLMLDRLSIVAPRLALSADGGNNAATSALRDLRVGINVLDLQAGVPELPERLRRTVRTMLDAVASHYRRHSLDPADSTLLGMIDRVIAEAVQDPATITRALLLQLSGIRRGLFPDAPPYTSDMARDMMQQASGRPA